MDQKSKYNRGFTLVELLVTVAIICILTAIVFVSATVFKNKAKDAKVKTEVRHIALELEVYASVNAGYPHAVKTGGVSGQENFWCVGASDCMIVGTSFANNTDDWESLGIVVLTSTAPDLHDLPSNLATSLFPPFPKSEIFIDTSNNINKGYVYVSCTTTGANGLCPIIPATDSQKAYIIYPQSTGVRSMVVGTFVDAPCSLPQCGGGNIGGLTNGQMCTTNASCLSNNCVADNFGGHVCTASGGGTALNGNSCSLSSECASGSCLTEECNTGYSLGHFCQYDYDCKSYSCENSICVIKDLPDASDCSFDYNCESGKCVSGQCNVGNPGGTGCSQNFECASYNCSGSPRKCVDKAYGATCGADYECKSPAKCISGQCNSGKTTGQTCTNNYQCLSYNCSGTCVAPGAALGSACSFGYQCTSGSCVGGVCNAGGAANSSCTQSWQCASNNCNGTTCVVKAFGDTCSSNYECASPSKCVSGKCNVGQVNGTGCENNYECSSYICSQGECNAGHGYQGSCAHDYDCTSHNCVDAWQCGP